METTTEYLYLLINAPKVDFEASGTYFGNIGTSLANDAAIK